MPKELFNVKVINSEKLLFEGQAESVTSVNAEGTFDILPHHTNFISIITKKLQINLENGKKIQMDIDEGIIKCKDNYLNIYLGIKPDQIA